MKYEQDIIERLDRIEKTIHGMKERPLPFAEAAKYLGISESYLYKLTSQARIPHYKPGGKKVYFEKSQLDHWLLQNPVATQKEIETKAVKHLQSGFLRTGRIGGSR